MGCAMSCFGVVLWLFWSCDMAVLQPVWLAWGWQAGLAGWLSGWLAGVSRASAGYQVDSPAAQ